jgi:hypothetical protein
VRSTPAGVSHKLTENWQALDGAERQGGELSLALVDWAHIFKENTCIMVIVAGGSFPLNSAESRDGGESNSSERTEGCDSYRPA